MSHLSFISQGKEELVSVIRRALAQEVEPGYIRKVAESLMLAWEQVKNEAPKKMVEGELEFWCAVWTAQHLGDTEHWRDGVAQRDLEQILSALEANLPLPRGWHGARP